MLPISLVVVKETIRCGDVVFIHYEDTILVRMKWKTIHIITLVILFQKHISVYMPFHSK
jgi:hypothetical protein